MKILRGQVSVSLATALAVGGMVVSGVASYYSAQAGFYKEIGNTQVQLTALSVHGTDVDKRLDRIEAKLDASLEHDGVDPRQVGVLPTGG